MVFNESFPENVISSSCPRFCAFYLFSQFVFARKAILENNSGVVHNLTQITAPARNKVILSPNNDLGTFAIKKRLLSIEVALFAEEENVILYETLWYRLQHRVTGKA